MLLTPGSLSCPVVDAGPDFLICEPGQRVQLMGSIQGQYDRFYWEPTTGLTPPNSLTPFATVFQTTTYKLVAEAFDPLNLIDNGDFEFGVSGFNTAYQYVPEDPSVQNELVPEGTYSVGSNPNDYHTGFSPCTAQSGSQMMIVNGAGALQEIWCQSVNVEPDTEYEIKFWLASVNPASPAQIQIEMDGQSVGPVFSAGPICVWDRHVVRWNSGGATSVNFCLINRNTALGGNDFAIDNICMNKICKEEDEVTIEIEEVIAEVNGPYTITCDDDFLELNGSGSSEGPGYTYEWSTQGGRILSGGNTLYPIIDRPGIYTLRVTGPNGCVKEATIEVFGNIEPPEAIATVRDSVGCGNDSARIRLLVIPVSGVYFYDWNGPNGYYSQEMEPWVREPGIYYFTVTDIYGCTTFDSIRVHPGGELPRFDLSYLDTLSCAIDSVQLRLDPVDPMQEYQWRGPNGFESDDPEPWVRDTGWYIVIAGTDPGCLARDSIFVSANQLAPAPDITGNNINCTFDTAFLRASWPPQRPVREWEWTTPQGNVLADSSIASTEEGWHFFHMTYENGCQRLDSILVTIDTIRSNLDLAADTITCLFTRAGLEAFSPDTTASLRWSGPNGFSSMSRQDTVSFPGWYVATLTRENGCVTADSIEVLRDAEVPSISLLPDTLDCRKDSITLRWNSPDSNLVFRWIGPGGFRDSTENPVINMPGTYYLEVRSPNDCTVSDSVTIGIDRDKPGFLAATDSIDCAKDSALLRLLILESDVDYRWQDMNGNEIGSGQNVTVFSGGDYTLIATAPNGCTSDTTLTVKEDADRPDIALAGARLDCNQTSVWLRANSMTDSLRYNWSGPGIITANGDSALIDRGGNYSIEVVATNGCRASAVVQIEQDTMRPDLNVSGDSLNCRRTSVTLDASSQTGNNWAWTGPNAFSSTQEDPVVSSGGTYSVTVTSANGCSTTSSITVPIDTLRPDIRSVAADTINCYNPMINVIPDVGDLQDPVFQWSGPGGFSSQMLSPEVDRQGDYRLVVTNDNGCSDTFTVTVVADIAPPSIDVSGDTLTCSRPQTNLLVITSNEIRASTWRGPNGQTKNGASWVTSTPGWYTATITGANGCQSSDSFEVVVDTIPPDLILAGDTLLYCLKSFGELYALADPVRSAIQWYDPNGDPISSINDTLAISQGGTYRAEAVHPRNGCIQSLSWTVREATPPDNIRFEARPPGCGGDQGSLRISGVSGGSGSIRYSMDGTPVTNLTGSAWAPGTYRLRAIDELGCFTETSVVIPERIDPQLQLVSQISLLLGERVRLIPQLNIDTSALSIIRWSPGAGLSCTGCFSPWASPAQTTEYLLYVEDTTGCATQARVQLRIEQPQIFIPNAFTPHNKDGANDYFIPSLGPGLGVKEMAVFDRWGNRLWTSGSLDHNDPEAGWDGTGGTKQMLPGVYVYRIVITLPGGKEKIFVGDVTLID